MPQRTAEDQMNRAVWCCIGVFLFSLACLAVALYFLVRGF